MEYVEGLDLAKLVKAKGPLPVAHACNFVYQAALGFQHAHEQGMVHRDIKPGNLMLSREGKKAVVKVLDFGLAKVTSEGQADSGLTREGQMLGTPDFIAPEQIRDAQSADIRADIYSLGCTLYYLLTGDPPFQGEQPLGPLPGPLLDGRRAAEPRPSRGPGRAGRAGGQDDGQGAGAAVPDTRRGGPGAGAVLQAGREPAVRTEPRDLPRRAGSPVSPACRRCVRTGATGDPRRGPSPRATWSSRSRARRGWRGRA